MLKRIVNWFKGFLPCSHVGRMYIGGEGMYTSYRYFKCDKCGFKQIESGSMGRDW